MGRELKGLPLVEVHPSALALPGPSRTAAPRAHAADLHVGTAVDVVVVVVVVVVVAVVDVACNAVGWRWTYNMRC